MLTRHEYSVLMLLVSSREDVCTLDSLRVEAKDVVDNEESTLRILWASGVGLHSVNGDILALWLVALGLDWWDGAAGV